LPHKLDVLAKHCADAGRDVAAINKTWLASAMVGSTPAEAQALLDARVAAMGMGSWAELDDGVKALMGARLLVGTPEELAEKVASVLSVGLDGVVLNFPANGADPASTQAHTRAVLAGQRAARRRQS
jgi:alkanesulfonate monooxygenase SsuD/methylene tetrahydromethanopterin reductase-like flavin-dependent oxidoreductase (luciferase family)